MKGVTMRYASTRGLLSAILDDPRLARFTDTERLRLLRLLRVVAVEEHADGAAAYLPEDLAALIGFGDDLPAYSEFLERLRERGIVWLEDGRLVADALWMGSSHNSGGGGGGDSPASAGSFEAADEMQLAQRAEWTRQKRQQRQSGGTDVPTAPSGAKRARSVPAGEAVTAGGQRRREPARGAAEPSSQPYPAANSSVRPDIGTDIAVDIADIGPDIAPDRVD